MAAPCGVFATSEEKLRFSGKVAKKSNLNNFVKKSLQVHTANEGEIWRVNFIEQAPCK